ncbi:DUF4281 domain-containing protein [Amylibacter sp. SFDW26]|uniref:abscisic acid-deficient protein Aba4 family protein n=1 Tax=Amylibacter sp. SFDW26 TaxID=2652722 RepID=UPI0012628C85|nr:abscisic acid-deficient protein Aba4 family protein [Amylibacter sp. SFDW26]KAB7610347.1 DUF4281 domain-containing protein [Amylibacter sp. SFDW26]
MKSNIHPRLKSIYKLQGILVQLGWLCLVASLFFYSPIVLANAIILILCCLYTYLVLFGRRFDLQKEPFSVKSFFTLDGVLKMLKSTRMAFTAWTHILVFDLFAAWVIVVDLHSRDLHGLIGLPFLLLTMMFGPMGLLAYVVVRMIMTGNFVDIGFW